MTHYYYGCDEVVQGWSRYHKLCTALELDLNGEKNPPTIATLNRWRVDSPRGFAFLLHVEQDLITSLVKSSERTSPRLAKDIDTHLESTFEKARALAAKALIISMPPEFTPSTDNKNLLVELRKRILEKQDKNRSIILEPSGLWERSTTLEWAEGEGFVLAHDPFMAMRDGDHCSKQDACFVINERAGMRRKFDQFDFEDMLDWSASAQRAFLLLRGRFKAHHAKELLYLLRD